MVSFLSMLRVETYTLLNLGSIEDVCGILAHVLQSGLIFIEAPMAFDGEYSKLNSKI